MYAVKPLVSLPLFGCAFAIYISSMHGVVHEVPLEYETIQLALDWTEEGDTVRVAPGVYHEFLSSRTNLLTLAGWYTADTLPEQRTILDPIPGGVDTPSAVVFRGDTVVVRNFAFVNRPEMREPDWATRTGGIRHFGDLLTLENCRFDSVSQAVYGGTHIVATNCAFEGCLWLCLYPNNNGSVHTEYCSFEGSRTWLVRGFDGSRIIDCAFRRGDTGSTVLLALSGQDMLVSRCRFGPSGRGFALARIYTLGDCVIEDCEFSEIDQTSAIVEAAMPCPATGDTPLVIRGNVFRDYRGQGLSQGPSAISFICQDPAAGNFGLVEDNVFMEGEATGNASPGIEILGSVEVISNMFSNLSPEFSADLLALSSHADTIIARNNSFLPPGRAAESEAPYFDARENWWGDSTGPYNSAFNPEGQGSTVGNTVLFIPWLTEPPDSLPDTSGTAAEERVELPHELSLSAYPNPFNPTTTISFSLAHSSSIQLELFDLLGRHVATLANDFYSAGEHSLAFDGSSFSSGVYLARLNSPNASVAAKLLLLK